MTPEIDAVFSELKEKYGENSIQRVERMMAQRSQDRHPMQKEAKWIMPGLTSKPWHDPYENEHLCRIARGLEGMHPIIKGEILSVIGNGDENAIETYQHYKVVNNDWDALYLFKNGRIVESNRGLVPQTFSFMETSIGDWLCPLLEMHFSILHPRAIIPSHCDLWNFTINLHLAVDIPDGCGIDVAGIERAWTEGNCLLFDYSYLHRAWNNSNKKRICLLMDIWNPEVTLPEREAILVLITEVRKIIEEMSD